MQVIPLIMNAILFTNYECRSFRQVCMQSILLMDLLEVTPENPPKRKYVFNNNTYEYIFELRMQVILLTN